MNTSEPSAFIYLQNSQKAYEQGDVLQARHWARLAVSTDPRSEEAWLWMGALASPQASVGYLRRALEINPASSRARQGLAWAMKRVAARQMAETRPHKVFRPVQTAAPLGTAAAQSATFTMAFDQPGTPLGAAPILAPSIKVAPVQPRRTRVPARLSLSGALGAIAVLCLAVALVALLNTSSARAFILGRPTIAAAAAGQAWANAHIDQSAGTSTAEPAASEAPTATALPQDTATSLPEASNTPAASATPQPSPTLEPASPTPLPTDTAAPAAPTARPTRVPVVQQDAPAQPAQNDTSGGTGQRIVVSISEQHMYVYEGDSLVYSFVISTGLRNSTAVGTFKILDKIPNAYASTWDLWMPEWMGIYYSGNLENGIHALPILSNGQTLWAGLLGQPASFGCIILGTADAQTLYNWTEVGTPVIIQR